jgi:hypothetical protein
VTLLLYVARMGRILFRRSDQKKYILEDIGVNVCVNIKINLKEICL